MLKPVLALLLAFGSGAHAQEAAPASTEAGLAAWARIEAVVTHPRCANCHVGSDNIPMWTGPEFAAPGHHGMNIHAGESRIGAETLLCSTCHVTSMAPNSVPHAPPHAGIDWQLAPVEFEWFGKTGKDICLQMRDPARNGGRDAAGLVDHLTHDAALNGTVVWAWKPGPGREPAPGTFEEHVRDMEAWGAAGQPCPE